MPVHASCETCVDARNQPWYNYNQKQQLKHAHFHSPLDDVAKLQANQDKAAKMIAEAGAMCSQFKFLPSNRLAVKLSDCISEVVLDHDMAKFIGRHLFSREQQLVPHRAPHVVMVRDAGSNKKYALSLWVLQLSPAYKGKTVDIRRVFHLDGDPFNCKLDNLLVLSQDRMSEVSDKCPFGIHNLRTTSRQLGDTSKEALLLRNTWSIAPDETVAPRKSLSMSACGGIQTRAHLFEFCRRQRWSVQFNAELRFKCKDPPPGKHPSNYYSAILTVAKTLAVSDVILAILGKTPKNLHGSDKSQTLRCDDACWLN